MSRLIKACVVCILAGVSFLAGQITHRYVVTPTPSYVLSTFDGTNISLQILWSLDAINFWNTSPEAYYAAPYQTVRDPSIMKYGSQYWLAHTNAAAGFSDDFYIASSTDAVTWTAPTLISVTGGGLTPTYTWAPEWFIDPADTGLSSVHVFVSIATSGTDDFRIYEMHPTASDFSTWSNPVLITITGPVWAVDPFVVYKGSTYYLWYKSSATYICYASSSTLTGTYTNVQTGDWASWGALQEGPALLNMGGSPVKWRIYMDDYQNSYSLGHLYYSESTDDWATWSARTAIRAPGQAKHGTVWRLQ